MGPSAQAAQLPHLFRVVGDGPGDWFGYAVAPLGDVNGDGVPDFAVGAHQNKNGMYSPEPGYARVFSGADGAELYTFRGEASHWHFGIDLHGGADLDGDGVPDLLVGAYKYETATPELGLVRIFSGASGALLHSQYGTVWGDRIGFCVAWTGDLDGDGVPDYMYGAPMADAPGVNSGRLLVRSGATHGLIHSVDGQVVGTGLGWSCRPIGDLDGDGVPDLLVGAAYYSDSLASRGGVWALSGADASQIHFWSGAAADDYFGYSIDGIGDVDGDGIDDVLVGAPQSRFTGPHYGPGYARVFSGQGGELLLEVRGDALKDQFGHCVRGVGDVTGDGRADFLVGAPRAVTLGLDPTGQAGYARLFSGRDGAPIHTFEGSAPDDQFGVSLAALGDLDGDGFPEFLFGACEDVSGQTRAGYAEVVSGGLLLTARRCVAAVNSTGVGALLDHAGTLSVARNDFSLRASPCPAGQFGVFIRGTHPIQVPFGDGWRCVGGNTVRLGLGFSGSGGTAELTLDLSSPSPPGGAIGPGSTVHFQYWYRDVQANLSGFNLTDALIGTFSF